MYSGHIIQLQEDFNSLAGVDLPPVEALVPHFWDLNLNQSVPKKKRSGLSVQLKKHSLWKGKGQRCIPRDPKVRLRMKLKTIFMEASKKEGNLLVEDAFQDVLDWAKGSQHHDVLGCADCWATQYEVYCIKSRYNPAHPLHTCPSWRDCCTE